MPKKKPPAYRIMGRYDLEKDMLSKWGKRIIMLGAVSVAVSGLGFNITWPFFLRADGQALAQAVTQTQQSVTQTNQSLSVTNQTLITLWIGYWQDKRADAKRTLAKQPSNQAAQFQYQTANSQLYAINPRLAERPN